MSDIKIIKDNCLALVQTVFSYSISGFGLYILLQMFYLQLLIR